MVVLINLQSTTFLRRKACMYHIKIILLQCIQNKPRTHGKRINTATYLMTTSKNLSESVASIINGKGSKDAKKKALISLGITNYEATLLTESLTIHRVAKGYTFGVEIECLVPRDGVARAASANGLSYQYERYNHNDSRDHFKFTTDSSIIGENPIECVSPVLSSKGGFAELKKCCKTLNEAGAAVNRSTGLHVHIGAADLTDKQYVRVFINYQKLERVIDSFMARSRRARNSQYCDTLLDHSFTEDMSKMDVSIALSCRYHKVNAQSYYAHKTIEFRQHQGSTDFKKISAWVKFCAKLVEWSKNHVLSEEVTRIEDIEFLTDTEKRYFADRARQLA